MRILVVEDDLEAQRYLVNGLKEAGHVVDDARMVKPVSRWRCRAPMTSRSIDRMLPKMDGLQMVEELREHSNATPGAVPRRAVRGR